MDIVLWISACAIACAGIACIAGDYLFVKKGKGERADYRIIPIYDGPAEAERALNKCLARFNWNGPDSIILLVDMGMGDETARICRRAMSEMYGVLLCGEAEIAGTIRRLDKSV